MLERDGKVEEQAGYEQEVAEAAATYGSHDQACHDENCAEDWNTTVDRFAEVRMNSARLTGFAFR
jgi:hypothetical protein